MIVVKSCFNMSALRGDQVGCDLVTVKATEYNLHLPFHLVSLHAE